jgi:hypothetical protein
MPKPVRGPTQTIQIRPYLISKCVTFTISNVVVAAHGAQTYDVLPRLSCLDDAYLMMIHQGADQH